MQRHDLYGPIHKGLRLALSNLVVRIGSTDFADPEAGRFPIRAGDAIRFQPIDPTEYEARRHERL